MLCTACPLDVLIFLGGSVRMTYRYSIPHVSTRRHQELKYLPNSPGAMSAELGMVGYPLYSTVLL